MMMLRRVLVVSVSALLLASCASLQQRSFSSLGQFEDFQLNDQLYRVRYVGNGYTSQSEAEQIALLQAARITLQNGFRYFAVVEDGSVSRVVPQQRAWNAGVGVYGGYGSGYYYPYAHNSGWYLHDRFQSAYFSSWDFMDRVQVNYTIAVTQTKSNQQTQFDAQTILRSLGSRYRLNPDGSEVPRGTPKPATSAIPSVRP